jgi:ATP-dependent helicase/nuclease subunit A
MSVAFTPQQRAAIEDRAGSALLAANAGSGKTAVMAERCVEAVLRDGVAVGSILALTFTEKAAGELRDRVRRRFVSLGEEEAARAVDAGWIGTIHGFCARILRARPLAAGLDPRFEVLDEPAAERLAGEAYERAFEEWARERGAPAIDVAAAYGAALREMVLRTHATLRSRGETRPVLRVPPPVAAPDAAALTAARAAAASHLATAGTGRRLEEGVAALEVCERVLGASDSGDEASGRGSGVPVPTALAAAELKKGAKALGEEPSEAYRAAFAAYRQSCADHHARAALEQIAVLLERFGERYAEAKARRAGLDFEDLELGVRDLLAADPEDRQRWSERFALIMVDEFQDTNRLQLDVLEALERDNLFAVGDEFQSIYGFRHADVTIFRERRAALGELRVRPLTANFRSREELLDVLNAAYAPQWPERFAPLLAGNGATADVGGELRLFDPGDPGGAVPSVELLVTDSRGWDEDTRLGLAGVETKPHRRAEARALAHRLREEIDMGRPARDIVVLVRATASLRVLEEALEEQGVTTYVVGGRGYWSQQPVRDGIAYLAALANPLDEEALLGVLASPFCGVGADALILLADAGRELGGGVWAALCAAAGADSFEADSFEAAPFEAAPSEAGTFEETPSEEAPSGPGPSGAGAAGTLAALPAAEAARLREFAAFFADERAHAERLPVEVLLERALEGTGYDLAVLARASGERRLANLRKLMRLAREYERAEGRDLRGFLTYAAGRDLAAAREGEAPLESEGLDAVRLMTIHRAKGLEFPVVCVADLGRQGAGQRDRLLIGPDGEVGLRLQTPGGGESTPALAFERLAAAAALDEDAEERRLFYVAMTRARDRLILSGSTDPERQAAPRPGGPPLDWIAPALLGGAIDPLRPERVVTGIWDGRLTRVLTRLVTPATIPAAALPAEPRPRPGTPGTALPARAKVVPSPAAAQPAPQRLSYSTLGQYARCPYRFYLQRTLRLPDVRPPEWAEARASGPLDPRPPEGAEARTSRLLDARSSEGAEAQASGPVHERSPEGVAHAEAVADAPALDPRVRGTIAHRLLEELDFTRPVASDPSDVIAVGNEAGVELAAEDVEDIRGLVAAFGASPLCGRLAAARDVRREAGFAFRLDPAGGALVNGFVDVLAREEDDAMLIVDYKSDRLEGAEPADVVEAGYATQRIVYALAALREGAAAVEVAYCFLERPEVAVGARFTQRDIPELAERLTQLAEGVLAADYPVTPEPHRALCGDCPGRASLCSWPEEMTMREVVGDECRLDPR